MKRQSDEAVKGGGSSRTVLGGVHVPRPTLCAAFLAVLLAPPASAVAAAWSIPAEHPRLLVHRDDLPGLRKRCGVRAYRDVGPASAPFAGRQAAFEQVRRVADRAVRSGAKVEELYAVALAHLVLGEPGRRDACVECVEAELRRQLDCEWREDAAIVALDWCWDALSKDLREKAAAHYVARMQPLTADVNPLDHLAFHPRVCDLAAAVVLYNARPSAGADDGARRVREVLDAGGAYLQGPFVQFWQQKGPAATSPTNGIRSEADAVLAAEVWQTGAGGSLWPALAESLGRSLDVYFWSHTGHAATRFGFPWNDGTWAPDRPGVMAANWPAAVAWVIAARTGSGVARWFTNEYPEPALDVGGAKRADDASRNACAWSSVIYGDAPAGTILRQACPLGRRIPNGLVVMRTGWAPDAAVVMANVGQPYWRSRQHYNAGHFQVLRAGRLTTGSDEDVTHDATPARGGDAFLDGRMADWDLFAHATIAHNCITAGGLSREPLWRGHPSPSRGNQRILEGDYEPIDPPIEETERITGRLVAFETNSFYTYAAANLTLAYSGDVVRSYVRHFLLVNAGAFFVCDHIRLAQPATTTTWHLHLPERPRLRGEDLPDADRIQGSTSKAGVWKVRGPDDWLDVAQADGRLFVRTLLPANAQRHLVGGPKEAATIPRGDWAGRPYFGSSETGYERRLWPAPLANAPQAWYRLGEPRSLGPQFGLRSNWGRLDVTAGDKPREIVFLHLLVPTDVATRRPPAVESTAREGSVRVVVALPSARCEVRWLLPRLDGGGEPAGSVNVLDANTGEILFQNDLAATVMPEKPLPGERP